MGAVQPHHGRTALERTVVQVGDFVGEADREIDDMAERLRDPHNAEPCATFPVDPERVASPGMYAWHGDETAKALVLAVLGSSRVVPLYAGQAGATSAVARRPSGATLKSRVLGNHLRGNTRASTFRRTLAALLWEELRLTCIRPRTLDVESNTRLTGWMHDHLSVATISVDGARLGLIEDHLLARLDPPLNLDKVGRTDGRTRLRALRREHLGTVGREDPA
jgi:hypothetical protein